MTNAICSNPCIAHFYCKKHPYLLTDFSKKGSGYDVCQPNSDDPLSMAAIHREMEGGDYEFFLPKSTLRLHSIGFGSRTTRCRRESSFHSHLGEAFALDWAIHKNWAKLWGVRFTSLTYCYALRFILSYNGPNLGFLQLQM